MIDKLSYNNGSVLLSALGSFWTSIFKDQDLIQLLSNASEYKIADAYFRICEAILGTNIHDIPVFARETWKNVTFLKSNINVGVGDLFRYGDEDLFYGDPDVFFGGVSPTGRIAFPLPDDIVDTGSFISNKVYDPSLVLVKGKDYTVRNRVIVFEENLFENNLVPIRDVIDAEGNVVDQEISLWIPRVNIDKDDLYQSFGTLLDIKQESSEAYKTLIRTIFGLYNAGPKRRFVLGFLNSVFGLPISLEDEDTVKYIVEENGQTQIFTEKRVYDIKYPSDLASNIFPGAPLDLFQPFYDIVDVTTDDENQTFIQNQGIFNIPEGFLAGEIGKSLTISRNRVRVSKEVGLGVVSEQATDDEQVIIDRVSQFVGLDNVVGEPYIEFDLLDFVAKQVKANILNIVLKNSNADSSKFTEKLQKIFKSAIPAFLAIVITSFLDDPLEDEYDIGINSGESIGVERGKALEDFFTQAENILDGYYGFAKVGFTLIVESDNIIVGERKIFPFLSVQKR